MPVVPIEQNRVGIAEATDAKFRAPDTSGTGLEALGSGMEKLGQAGAQASVSLDQVQNHYDQINARNLALSYKAKADPLVTDYTTLEGANAVNGWQQTATQLKGLKDETLSQASNPRMKGYLQQLLIPADTEYSSTIQRHSRQQQFVMSDNTYKSERQMAVSEAANLALTDPQKSAGRLAAAQAANERLAALHGWLPAQKGAEWQDQIDKVHNGVIEQGVASGHDDSAISYFAQHQGEMSIGARNHALEVIKKPLDVRQDEADWATISSGPIPKEAQGSVPQTTPAHVTDGVFHAPVTEGHVTNTYAQHLARGSHGLDIGAAAGSAVHPIAGGVVEAVSSDARSGNYVVIKHPDGHTSSYAHLAHASVKEGDTVQGNDVIGTVGLTGHTTGPHVHLRTKDASGKDVDPQSLLGTQAAGGTANATSIIGSPVTPRRYDKAALEAAIDSHTEWTPERRQRMREFIDHRVAASDNLIDRNHDDAADAAYTVVGRLGDKGFTDINQIPADIRANLKPQTLVTLQGTAESNKKALETGTETKPNGPDVQKLHTMRFYEPDKFIATNLGQYQRKISNAEMDELLTEQARMKTAKPNEWSPRQGIVTALEFGQNIGGIKLKPDEKAVVMTTMEHDANALYAAKKQPLTDSDYQDLFRRATRSVTVRYHGLLGGQSSTQKPVYQLGIGDVPGKAVDQIKGAFRKLYGRDPSDDEVVREFAKNPTAKP